MNVRLTSVSSGGRGHWSESSIFGTRLISSLAWTRTSTVLQLKIDRNCWNKNRFKLNQLHYSPNNEEWVLWHTQGPTGATISPLPAALHHITPSNRRLRVTTVWRKGSVSLHFCREMNQHPLACQRVAIQLCPLQRLWSFTEGAIDL